MGRGVRLHRLGRGGGLVGGVARARRCLATGRLPGAQRGVWRWWQGLVTTVPPTSHNACMHDLVAQLQVRT